MNIYEIGRLPKVTVSFEKYYYKIDVEDGYYMTAHKGDNYTDYVDYQHAYFPKSDNFENFYIINEVKHLENINKQFKQIEDYE